MPVPACQRHQDRKFGRGGPSSLARKCRISPGLLRELADHFVTHGKPRSLMLSDRAHAPPSNTSTPPKGYLARPGDLPSADHGLDKSQLQRLSPLLPQRRRGATSRGRLPLLTPVPFGSNVSQLPTIAVVESVKNDQFVDKSEPRSRFLRRKRSPIHHCSAARLMVRAPRHHLSAASPPLKDRSQEKHHRGAKKGIPSTDQNAFVSLACNPSESENTGYGAIILVEGEGKSRCWTLLPPHFCGQSLRRSVKQFLRAIAAFAHMSPRSFLKLLATVSGHPSVSKM